MHSRVIGYVTWKWCIIIVIYRVNFVENVCSVVLNIRANEQLVALSQSQCQFLPISTDQSFKVSKIMTLTTVNLHKYHQACHVQ